MTFEELGVFTKDLKELLKKYRTLNEDLGVVKKVLEVMPDEPSMRLRNLQKKMNKLSWMFHESIKFNNLSSHERPPFSFRIDGLGLTTCIIKIKGIACKSLKGRGVNSGLRLIYAYFKEEQKVVFIELFHKNDKENEDRKRIMDNFK